MDNHCYEFQKWFDNALPGDKYCYYTGPHVAGNLVGRMAFNSYLNGDLVLFQKREGRHFSYWAQRRDKHIWG